MNNSRKNGFTLVEIIVAAMILSAATITIGAICNKCISSVKVAREHEIAWQILDNQLSIVDYVGLKTFTDAGRMTGQTHEADVDYTWRLQTTPHNIDSLTKVDMSVTWKSAGRENYISASTMLFDKNVEE